MRSFGVRMRCGGPWLSSLLVLAAGAGCARSTPSPNLEAATAPADDAAVAAPDSGVFIARLGKDTVAVERFVRTATRVDADVIARSPRTVRTRYTLDLSPSGGFVRLEARTLGGSGDGVSAARREVVERVGDSLRVETEADGQRRTQHVAAPADVLPFIDLAHWPFELALLRARASGAADRTQPLLTGGRVARFPIARVGDDSMTITHPLRGTMRASVDARGRLLGLDAGATTRKLLVERRTSLPAGLLDSLATRWAALDAAGRGIGALSGRAQATRTVGGATLTVDYGQPALRGRTAWGVVVPWGRVWRTGANQATHLTTDRTVVLGSGADTLVVPAGRYTLFSVPRPEGGHLIVNRQTGQAGTAYDAARDLGRVPLTARPLPAPVELFTIAVDGSTWAGLLRLQWDRTELVVPFRTGGPPAR